MRFIGLCVIATLVLLQGCAVSPDVQARVKEKEVRIQQILDQSVDVPELGEPQKCLADRDFRNYRALNDRYMLFEGRGDTQWINAMRMRCPDLRHGTVLRMKRFSSMRMCDGDTFQVLDWFDWPWYRRWPWRWGAEWSSGATCALGKFHPVSELQVAEIKGVIRSE